MGVRFQLSSNVCQGVLAQVMMGVVLAVALEVRASHKGGGRNPKAFAERPDLANIELPFARQDFRNHALTANLVQIALFDAVLLHQKLECLHAGNVGQRMVFGLKVLDQVADDIDQTHRGMVFVASGLIQQGFEHRHHPLVVRFVPDGGDIGGAAKGLPRREQVLHLDVCIYDFNAPLS